MPKWKEKLKSARRRSSFSYSYSPELKNRIVRTQKMAKFAKLFFISIVILILGFIITVPVLSLTLPSPENIVRKEGFATKILDRNGKLLYDIFVKERRTPVELSEIPDYLKQATIAVEDKNFYTHQGFDPLGMIRGLSRLITRGRAQGGSTLTQQLVKNVLLTSERSVLRKVREFVLALQIESRYSKDDILKLYLNEAPYGGTAWGVQAAAETYFGKNVQDLNLVESAFLAGLPQRPSYYSPYSTNPKAYVGRTEDVLRRMREDGYITRDQEDSANEELENLQFQTKGAGFKAPHFVQYVQSILEERYGQKVVEQGGLQVTTTLDLDLQEEAQKIVAEEIEKVENLDISNGAAVVLNPETGEILSMVGSRGYESDKTDGQVNVTMSLRQPGSAIKPITYVTALKKGYTASTLLMDVPTIFPGGVGQPPYEPGNYDGKYRGPVQLRYALANSINLPAVKMLALVGIKETLKTAYDLGINSLEPTDDTLKRVGLSLTLGGGEVKLLELTAAYSAFMNKGYKVEPISILKVQDQEGRVLEETRIQKGKRVLGEEEAFIISDILSDNQARSIVFGLNSLLNIPGRQVAVKTGTTNDKRDNWAIGGNPQIIAGVWVGNNDNSEMREVASGVSGASPIWRRIVLKAFEGKPNVTFDVPESVVRTSVDKISGYAAHDGFESREEYFVKGTEPGEDSVHVRLKVCKNEGKLATPSQIAAGDYEEKEYFVFKEEDPTAASGETNKWQEGILNWINEDYPSDERYHPPSDYCTGSNNQAPLNVEFVEPRDRDSNLGNDIKIRFSVDSVYKITETRLEVGGSHIRTFTSPPYEHTLNLTNGVYEIRAIAKDEKGNESDRRITVGIGVPWDSPSPTPTATP